MSESVRRRFEPYAHSPLSWHVGQTGKPALISWHDHLEEDLGPDPYGSRFTEISQRMLSGRYYPPDAIEFFGLWQVERRDLRAGDRILQRARLLPFLPSIGLWAMTEAYVAESGDDTASFGYLTTRKHFGRGIWTATLRRTDGQLVLTVDGLSGPQSWLFWLGLPIARALQKRAWRRAVEEFRKV